MMAQHLNASFFNTVHSVHRFQKRESEMYTSYLSLSPSFSKLILSSAESFSIGTFLPKMVYAIFLTSSLTSLVLVMTCCTVNVDIPIAVRTAFLTSLKRNVRPELAKKQSTC